MSNIANIVVFDGASTPVSHTLPGRSRQRLENWGHHRCLARTVGFTANLCSGYGDGSSEQDEAVGGVEHRFSRGSSRDGIGFWPEQCGLYCRTEGRLS